MSIVSKLELYVKSAWAQRSVNWRGLPMVPKAMLRSAPHNRAAFNEFVLWIGSLQLPRLEWLVDAGANHGDFSQAASALYPQAKMLLVEPLPNLKPRLQRYCEMRKGRWRVVDCALGNQPGSAKLYVDAQNDAIGSLVGFSEEYRQANPLAVIQHSVECRVTTMDDLCVAEGIKRIDLLKVDVEGFEFEVLQGARRMLPNTQAIVVELSLIRRAPGGKDGLLEMLLLLRNFGFEIVNVIPSLFASAAPWKPVEFNILARRTDLVANG